MESPEGTVKSNPVGKPGSARGFGLMDRHVFFLHSRGCQAPRGDLSWDCAKVDEAVSVSWLAALNLPEEAIFTFAGDIE